MRLHSLALLVLVALVAVAPTALSRPDELKRQGYLGAALRDPVAAVPGSEVASVAAGSVAERAGLRPGDRVLRVDGRSLDDAATLEAVRSGFRAGDTLRLTLSREGKEIEATVVLPPLPREEIPGVELEYGSVVTDRGHRLRTIVSRPKGGASRLPAILMLGWLSCDSVERPVGRLYGHHQLMHGIAAESGYVFMRVEKPGVGDSGGPPCAEADLADELAGYRAGLRELKRLGYVDPGRVVLLGISNGGGIAPLVAEGEPVAGIIATGGWVKTWYEHMIEHERRRMALEGLAPGEVNARLKGFQQLYTAYLIDKKTPGEAIAERPHLRSIWYDAPAHQYGRPAAFYQQLQELNLEEAWSKVDVPVLVVYGEFDWIMSREDHEMIVEIVNRRRPGAARLEVIPRMHHSFFVHDTREQSFRDYASGRFDPKVLAVMVSWLRDLATAPRASASGTGTLAPGPAAVTPRPSRLRSARGRARHR